MAQYSLKEAVLNIYSEDRRSTPETVLCYSAAIVEMRAKSIDGPRVIAISSESLHRPMPTSDAEMRHLFDEAVSDLNHTLEVMGIGVGPVGAVRVEADAWVTVSMPWVLEEVFGSALMMLNDRQN